MEFRPQTDPNHPERTGHGRQTDQGTESRLVFGRAIELSPSGQTTVTDYAVRSFLDGFVLPRFPNGFTVTTARGVWNGGHEDTFTVSVVYSTDPGETLDAGIKLEECRAEYIRLHKQDAVLRIDSPVVYSFE